VRFFSIFSHQQKGPSTLGPPIPSLRDALVLPVNHVYPIDVVVDVWFDLTCSDSAELWTSFFKDLIQTVADQKIPVEFRIHQYPLPYHIAGFEQLKAYLLVHGLQSRNRTQGRNYAYDLMDLSFRNQAPLLDVDHMNSRQIQSMIYDTYIAPLGIPFSKDQFLTQMNTREIWDHGRVVFKLATSRGVYGTPQFLVNGVFVYNADTFKKDDWLNLFKSLIK
jgi:hypothetical protein